MLGLATRARKLVSGTEIVVGAIKKGKAKCVIIANDLADNGQEEVRSALKQHPVPLVAAFSSEELSQAIGKQRKVLALTDSGFAKALQAKIKEGV
ncbi:MULTISPECIES: L7Ae/L30e/S12e/Gadd45 family ribosomal protein [Lactobacillus]|uniref:L7Ae/L30e/S12e/Gadd45 family ribosomal protein n=1 Tax=Lactobacillus TaxID=1578 RepID=UPI0012B32F8E